MIVENSKNYPTRKDMIIELENLYNSYLYGITNRIRRNSKISKLYTRLFHKNMRKYLRYVKLLTM